MPKAIKVGVGVRVSAGGYIVWCHKGQYTTWTSWKIQQANTQTCKHANTQTRKHANTQTRKLTVIIPGVHPGMLQGEEHMDQGVAVLQCTKSGPLCPTATPIDPTRKHATDNAKCLIRVSSRSVLLIASKEQHIHIIHAF